MNVRAIVKIHYDCNNNCIFCHASNNRFIKTDHDSIIKKIQIAPDLGIQQIIFSGGEPTIYPHLDDLMNKLSNLSLSSGFISNGRMFFYKEFAQKIMNYNADYFYISLHSFDPRTHDSITGISNSWKQVFTGIENILELSKPNCVDLTVNCVINHLNIHQLNRYVLFLHEHKINKIKLSIPDIKGNCLINKNLIVSDLNVISEKLNNCFDVAVANNVEISYDGLPPCLINKDFRNNTNNLMTNNILYMSETFEDCFYHVDEGIRWKPSECAKCIIDKSCPGIYEGYTQFRIKPIDNGFI